jgi:hypothetical protein
MRITRILCRNRKEVHSVGGIKLIVCLLFLSSRMHSQSSWYGLNTQRQNNDFKQTIKRTNRGVENIESEELKFISYLTKVKYEFGRIQSISVGLSLINFTSDDIVSYLPVWKYHGPFIESGVTLNTSDPCLSNKVGFEFFTLPIGGRISVIHLTDFSRNQFFLRPELGLSLCSILSVTYGYDIKIDRQNDFLNSSNVISVNLGFPIPRKKYRKS